jgi:transcriptional regulator with XRE-family HTH domain
MVWWCKKRGANELKTESGSTVAENAARIGRLLKAKREEQNISQRDIATILGYRNINFVSMIESGRSSPPLSRLPDIIRAYGLEASFILPILKLVFPDTFSAIVEILSHLNLKASIEKDINGIISKMEKYYDL